MNEIFKRRSIRKFEPRPVEPEKIERILRAAMAAPSAGNQRPWEFYVVRRPETIAELARSHRYAGCAAGAPVVLVPCLRTAGLRYPVMAEIDLAIATENILLETVSQGLGGVWLGIAPVPERVEKVDAILGLSEDLHAFALVPLGYPAETPGERDPFDSARIHYLD